MPRIVLVRPQIPANLGFIARVLDNFALDDWVAVGAPEITGTEAERTGAPARETLDSMRREESFDRAVGDRAHVIALTARTGRHRRCLGIRDLGGLRKSYGDDDTALVFGSEDRGLEAEELERCTDRVTIPLPGLTSMNLSHAVALTLYEWFRDDLEVRADSEEIRWATHAEKERLLEKTRMLLERTEYSVDDPHFVGAMRRLLGTPLEARDLRILERIVRHGEWRHDRS